MLTVKELLEFWDNITNTSSIIKICLAISKVLGYILKLHNPILYSSGWKNFEVLDLSMVCTIAVHVLVIVPTARSFLWFILNLPQVYYILKKQQKVYGVNVLYIWSF